MPGVDPSTLEDPEKEVQLGSPWRLKTIYRTNVDVAYAAGHYKSMIENAKDRPYWMYNAVLDANTRPSHRALHGKVFRYDDPIWNKIYPPNDWNCRCSVIPLDKQDIDEMNLKIDKGSDAIVKKLNPGKGWDYNPGKAFLEFDNDFGSNYKLNKTQPSFENYKRPSTIDIDEIYFQPAPYELPSVNQIGRKEFINLLKNEFDLYNKDYSIIETADNDKGIITLNRLEYILKNADGRERFIKFIKLTLQNPFEVYLSEYVSDKGFVEYRKHYIGLFMDAKKKRNIYTIFRLEKDQTIFWNMFPTNASDLDSKRKGILLYKK